MSNYFIVEHPTRGVVMEIIHETRAHSDRRGMVSTMYTRTKCRCSYNANRTEGIHFPELSRALKVSSELKGSYVLRVTTSPKFSIKYLDGRDA